MQPAQTDPFLFFSFLFSTFFYLTLAFFSPIGKHTRIELLPIGHSKTWAFYLTLISPSYLGKLNFIAFVLCVLLCVCSLAGSPDRELRGVWKEREQNHAISRYT